MTRISCAVCVAAPAASAGAAASAGQGDAAVVDGETFAVRKYVLVGQRVWQRAFSPDESTLFTTNDVSNDVSVIDVERLKVVKSITVGRFPWGVVVK